MRIVGGKYRGKKIAAPPCEGTRPTSDRTRETIFNILLHNPLFGLNFLKDKTVLDVFAGTGALGFEALSRGAKSVMFIENNKQALSTLYSNVKLFNLLSSCVLEQDVQTLKSNPYLPFDLIFMDPPYHQNLVLPALIQLETKGWMEKNAVILIELGKEEYFSLPSFLILGLERISGNTKILFCFKRN